MTRTGGALLAALVLACSGCGSSASAGTAEGNCRRYIALINDFSTGEIQDFNEFVTRLQEDVGDFEPGSGLRDSYDRLLGYIADGDESGAADETNFLYDTCTDVLDRY